jgi:uncharacterized protein YydD (DUF2326 family)
MKHPLIAMIEDFRDETVDAIKSYAEDLQEQKREIDSIKNLQCRREMRPWGTTDEGDHEIQQDLEEAREEYYRIDNKIYTEFEESTSVLSEIETLVHDASDMIEQAFNNSDPD